MTRPDRNEIERMLASGEPPKPPDGLLERLHADIPEDLTSVVKPEKREVSYRRQGWLVAASLIAVVGMGYVMMRVVDSPEFRNEMVVAESAPSAMPPPYTFPGDDAEGSAAGNANEAAPTMTSVMSKDAVKTEAMSSDVRQDSGGFSPIVGAEPEMASRDEAYGEDLDGPVRERVVAVAPAPAVMAPPPSAAASVEGRIGGVVGGIARDNVEEAQAERRAATPRPTPAIAARGQMQKSADRAAPARATSSGELVDTEADPVSTFGLRVANSSWIVVSSALRNGKLPDPQAVRPEELINHFRYSDLEPVRGEVTLRTEGAESPVRDDGSEHLLRVGIRVSSNEDLAVRGAKTQVEFEPGPVEAYRLVGYEQKRSRSAAMPQGDDLAPGHRVTALYDVRIGAGVASSAQVGVVRFQYETGKGEKKQVEQVIRKSDLGGSWSTASKDLQLAALVGDWAALLQRSVTKADAAALERRAAAVKGRWLGDSRVAELAELIGMTAKLAR